MANPVCSYCGQYEAVLMDTSLADGETQMPCTNCLLPHALSLAGAVTAGMTKEQADAYGELLDAIYANDPRDPKAPPTPPRKPRSKAKATQTAAGDADSDAAVSVELDDPCAQCGSREATGDAHKLVCDGCGAVLETVAAGAG